MSEGLRADQSIMQAAAAPVPSHMHTAPPVCAHWMYWVACVVIFAALVWITGIWNSVLSFNDYVQFYEAGRLAGTPQLYDASAAFAIQREISLFTEPSLLVVRPPFYALAYRPLAALGYWPGYAVFQAFNLVGFGALVWAGARIRPSVGLLVATSIPLLSLFGNGQDCLLAMAFAAAGLYAERSGRPFLAGLLFALCSIKFNLFVLLPAAVVIRRRWKILAGGAAGGVVLGGISFVVAGRDWPWQMLRSAATPAANWHPEQMPTIHGVLASLGTEFGWAELALVAAAVVVTAWAAARATDFAAAAGVALAGSLLVCYHAYVQDCVLLLLSYVLLARAGKWTAGLLIAASLPPLYLGMLTGAGANGVLAVLIAAAIVTAGVEFGRGAPPVQLMTSGETAD